MIEKEWDGSERRRPSADHDLLIRIHESLTNHIDKVERHFIDDTENFKEIRNDISTIQKWFWKATGAIGLLILIIQTLPTVMKLAKGG